MNLLESVQFRISVVGDKSGETYIGDFSCLRRLSHRTELAKDRYYRELLGPHPETATKRAQSQADIISDLSACLISTPTWWKEAGNGLDLVDDNLLQSVWNETVRIRVDAVNEVQEKAKSADTKLKEMAEKGDLVK